MSRLTLTAKSVLWLMAVAVCLRAVSSAGLAQYTRFTLVTTNKTTSPNHDANLVNARGLSYRPCERALSEDALLTHPTTHTHPATRSVSRVLRPCWSSDRLAR